jgi:N-acetylmuramoyl-L-alanine amidase
LFIALAGCSTAPQRAPVSPTTDQNSNGGSSRFTQKVEQVPEPPRLAPPPATIQPRTNPPTAAVTSSPPAMTSAPTQAHAAGYSETWISVGRWNRENHVGLLRRISSSPAPTYALTTASGVLMIQANTLRATWNGLEMNLGFEPQLIDDQPFVHTLDLKKNIEPLVRGTAISVRTNGVIIIDPGHGGQNAGAESVVNGVNEKEYTLDWARRLEPLLAARGWQVFLTRTNDLDVPLAGRVEFAELHQADLFISLHFNSAAPNHEQAGLETYCLTPAGMPSTLVREYPDDPSLVFPNNAFDIDNLERALRLHRGLLREVGMTDRGLRRARFMVVLRGQRRPAVLIEGGYLSNPREARRIADPAYRQKLAEAVAEALAEEPQTSAATSSTSDPSPTTPATNRSALH